MKIVFVGTAHPYRGGLASYNERLAKQFIDEGNDVDMITFKLQYPKIFFPGKTQFTNAPAPKNLRITRLLNSINPFNWIKTAKKIREMKPDMVIIRYWHPLMSPCFGSVSRMLKRNMPGLRVICIFDNVIPHEHKPGYNLLTKYFTGCIDGAIVMSKSVGNDLDAFRPNIPVKFNPHPLFDNYGAALSRSEALRQLNLSADYSYLLFFGFIRRYKGLDLLLKAFADKRLRSRKMRLIVAGEFYEDQAPYSKIIDDNKLNDEVILMNRFIDEGEVAALFSSANLVVQPYKSATQSGVTQIAYYFGRPMVVTNVGGLPEIVPDGKCGYVVNPDPESIADAVVDFFDNNREAFMVKNVEAERTKYAWNKLTAAICDVYECNSSLK